MKKSMLRILPSTLMVFMFCCGKGISSNFKEADYTKYKTEQTKKIDFSARKKNQ